jgi:DNA modification methylase
VIDRMPTILRGHAQVLDLPAASVDLIVTSPPYFGLRSYQDGGEHYDGQIGSEATPREFIAALVECTREWMRVLKPTGSIFVNLGDKYNSAASGQNLLGKKERDPAGRSGTKRYAGSRGNLTADTPQKSLLLLPERYRIACVDELGLIARAVIVWDKPNSMPESVTDRVRRSHEDWVHLTKTPRYFAAVDEIREPHAHPAQVARDLARGRPTAGSKRNADRGDLGASNFGGNPLGKLPGSVWEIATQPLKVPAELGIDHFAAFPMEWPRRLVLGWSPREVCTVCGEGRRPVVQAGTTGHDNNDDPGRRRSTMALQGSEFYAFRAANPRTISGYACACPDTSAPSTPGVVLDPFGGTGTTALVATMLGRTGISVDLSADYCRLAEWRASDPKERARAAGLDPDAVAQVHHQLPGQESLLDLLGDAS